MFRRITAVTDADEHVAVDGGFPKSQRFVRPLQTGEALPADRELRVKELRTSAHITTVRQAAEWINQVRKSRAPLRVRRARARPLKNPSLSLLTEP